ncbi:MAG: serine hydrolase [Rickettsiales bacterium]|nr:serine hydrolase [Rickettsiales bacterium]
MKDIGSFTFSQFSPEPLPLSQLKTTSRDKEFLTGRITASSQTPDDTKIFQIASITKTFTAAALVKMTTDPKYRDYFNVDDPLATPIYQFSPLAGSTDELTNFQNI